MNALLTQPLPVTVDGRGHADETVVLALPPQLPSPPAGLDHVGVVGVDPDEVAAAVVPTLLAARAAGHPITAVAGRRTVGLLREAVGELVSLSPTEVLRPGPERLLATLCDEVRAAPRRAFVLVEHPANADPADVAEWEAACTLVLADRPLTLLCACAGEGRAELATRHATLLTPTGRHDSPDHRAPADRSPSPAGLWGRRVLRFSVSGPDDLDRVAVRVGRTAGTVGLRGEAVDAAVAAAEEALAVAGEMGPEREVELRVHGTRLTVDVVGPGGGSAPDRSRLPEVPAGGAAAVHDDGATRRVRLLLAGVSAG